jgi:hypothetical protein
MAVHREPAMTFTSTAGAVGLIGIGAMGLADGLESAPARARADGARH